MKEVEMKEVEEEAAAGESPAARPSRNAGGTSFPRTTRRPRENVRRHVPPSDEDRRCPSAATEAKRRTKGYRNSNRIETWIKTKERRTVDLGGEQRPPSDARPWPVEHQKGRRPARGRTWLQPRQKEKESVLETHRN